MIPHSVLWIGPASGLEASPLAASPLVDIAWSRELADALALPLASFDCVVLHAAAPAAEAARRRLRAAGARAVLETDGPGARARRRPTSPRGPRGAAAAAPRAAAARSRPASSARAPRSAPRSRSSSARSGAAPPSCSRARRAPARRCSRAPSTRAARARAGAFVALNCAAFPDTLLESELFGHAKGAFTGADRAKDGLMALADGGTLFLDEVGETSVALQAKLLRALQEREVRPVGGTRARRVDVRVIAATNRDLSGEIAHGRFRADLYWRLAVFPIRVPPLRDRREDVLALAQHFLARHGAREGRPGCRLSREAEELLLAHHWPGNVRELENEILRALALSRALRDDPGRAPVRAARPAARAARERGVRQRAAARLARPLRGAGACAARSTATPGKRAETARNLGLTREGLYKKLKRHGIQ